MSTLNHQIMALYAEGLSLRKIAEKIHTTVGTVSGIVNRSGKANRGGKRLPAMDLTGQQFGSWIVLKRVGNNSWGATNWLCECECGTRRYIDIGNLRAGKSKSCMSCSARRRWKRQKAA